MKTAAARSLLALSAVLTLGPVTAARAQDDPIGAILNAQTPETAPTPAAPALAPVAEPAAQTDEAEVGEPAAAPVWTPPPVPTDAPIATGTAPDVANAQTAPTPEPPVPPPTVVAAPAPPEPAPLPPPPTPSPLPAVVSVTAPEVSPAVAQPPPPPVAAMPAPAAPAPPPPTPASLPGPSPTARPYTPSPVYSPPPPAAGAATLPYRSRSRPVGQPVNIDELHRTPEPPPTDSEINYEARLRSSFTSAQGLQGPLDGGWVMSVDGDDRYGLVLAERSNGRLEGAWRDLRREGALDGSGFIETLRRDGGQLNFSFRIKGGQYANATLIAGLDGRWTGELVDGARRAKVTMRRK